MRQLLARAASVVFKWAASHGWVRLATFSAALACWSIGLKPACWWPAPGE